MAKTLITPNIKTTTKKGRTLVICGSEPFGKKKPMSEPANTKVLTYKARGIPIGGKPKTKKTKKK